MKNNIALYEQYPDIEKDLIDFISERYGHNTEKILNNPELLSIEKRTLMYSSYKLGLAWQNFKKELFKTIFK